MDLHSNPDRGAPAAASPHQQRVDALVAQARSEIAGGPRPIWLKPAPPMPSPSRSPLDHRLAEEIDHVRRHLDLLGDVLAKEPILLHRHAGTLQSIDLITQLLGHLARVIESEDKAAAARQVGHGELRARLTRMAVEF